MSLPSGVKLPAFDNTLGALFIGSNIATLLYGVICLQTFLYITSSRYQSDRWWLKILVLDSVHQLALTAAIYKFLISDYLNPAGLSAGGIGSGEAFIFDRYDRAHLVLECVSFFCWRIWVFSTASLRFVYRVLFTGLTVSLALLSFDLAVTGFNHRILTTNTPSFILAYKLSTSSRIAFDVMITVAMTITLQRSRLESVAMDHIISLLTLFTVNTNLITTCLSISELVTFFALPKATVYGGIGFLSSKSNFSN
ncbi:hypothetical protein BYT27DRAFT_7113401 [Phlegmacium glaucopus]|nr:hypothetical protein BYT27DRAFT_7113401 [Phlegmacium glaucopus]